MLTPKAYLRGMLMRFHPRTVFLALLFLMLSTLFLTSDVLYASPQSSWDEVDLISRLVMGEARGEPFTGQVAVAAVILNRTQSPQFPNTVAGVVYDADAFESVSNGLIWQSSPSEEEQRAAEMAVNGWDPTGGALFFWNPQKSVSPWIWTRRIITQIGHHVFGL